MLKAYNDDCEAQVFVMTSRGLHLTLHLLGPRSEPASKLESDEYSMMAHVSFKTWEGEIVVAEGRTSSCSTSA